MKEMMMSYEELAKMSKEQRTALREKCEAILNLQVMGEEWDVAYACYDKIWAIEDEIYREENMDAFKAYEARMNEEDFDWGYYSDWHKDMFGYRPHYKRIPIDEADREYMFHKFHQERGL